MNNASVTAKRQRPTPRERVVAMFEKLGYENVRIRSPNNAWLVLHDLCSFEVLTRSTSGMPEVFQSWDSLTLCARYGIWISGPDCGAKDPPEKMRSDHVGVS